MDNRPLRQVYRDAVVNTAKPAVFFINPAELGDDPSTHASVIAKQYKAQFPNERGVDLSDPDHVEYAEFLAEGAKQGGPFTVAPSPKGRPFAQSQCVVSELGAGWDDKQAIVSKISGIPERHLKEAPGTAADYVRQTAVHEGEHCNLPPQTRYTHEIEVMGGEVHAEKKSYEDLEAQGKHDVLKTVKDAAVSNGVHDINHATAIKLKPDGTVDEKDYHATRSVPQSIYLGMADKVGIKSEEELHQLETEKPNMYTKLLKDMVEQGVYKGDQKEKIQRYVEAREALIKPDADTPAPTAEKAGATPKVEAVSTP